MSYATYAEYLAHPTFRAAVEAARSRADGLCEGCAQPLQTEPHHVKYCRWGAFDPPENLLMLCRRCHEEAHRCLVCSEIRLKAKEIKQGSTICPQCAEHLYEGQSLRYSQTNR